MKVKATRAALLKALAHGQSVVERRNTIPILANVLISARGGQMSLTTTDMEISLVEEVPAQVDSEGQTTAPAATLYEIMRRLPEGCELELDNSGATERLALRAERFSTNLVALPTEDFPAGNAGALPHKFSLPSKSLRFLIDRTRFAISTEETRYYLNGIYFHTTEIDGVTYLRAVATDGHRLARAEEPLPDSNVRFPGVIVPRKAVNELRKLLDEEEPDVEVSLSETRIQFRMGALVLTSKLIDGTFPDYERVIPRDNDKSLKVRTKDFTEAVARVAAISAERSRPVKLSLSRNLVSLSAASADHGSAAEELDGEGIQYDNGPLEIGFQARYLTDITDQIGQQAEFKFADGAGPTIIKDVHDERALYVLMPMRV